MNALVVEDGEHVVGGDRIICAETTYPRGTLVDVAVAVGHHRDDAGDAGVALDGRGEHGICRGRERGLV